MKWVGLAGFVVLLTTGGPAFADETACTQAATQGQELRQKSQLVQARKTFLQCAGPLQCPHVIEQDCAKWASEIVDAMPSIVIDAKDRDGHDVANVRVLVDGEIVAKELDGKAIALDPGPHTIVLQRREEKHSQQLIVKEGVKARIVSATFESDQPTVTRDANGHSIVPWVVMGVGAAIVLAGVAYAATAPALPQGCNADTRECEPLPGESFNSPSFADRQSEAGQSADQPLVGFAIAGAGVLVAVGGLLWHFLEKPEPRNKAGSGLFRPKPYFTF